MSLPFWNVAHRCNNEEDIGDAIADKANGVEFDVMSEGPDFVVRHPGPIDFHVPSLNVYLEALVAAPSSVSLAYVDYKGPDFSSTACERLVSAFHTARIPDTGMVVLFSTASIENAGLFEGLPKADWCVPQFDQANDPGDCQTCLRKMGFYRAGYADGVTSLRREPEHVGENVARAIEIQRGGGAFHWVGVWTLDAMDSMRRYLRMGVNLILTNDPDDCAEVLRESEFQALFHLAARGEPPVVR